MPKKPRSIASKRVAWALERLTKSALIDVVADLAISASGRQRSDKFSDLDAAKIIQPWINPVLRIRGDRPLDLISEMKKLDRSEEVYIENRKTHINQGLTKEEQDSQCVVETLKSMRPEEKTKKLD